MSDDPSVPTVFGWDASDYDWARGPMDLAAARRDGIDFFTHKATEATSTKHVHYGEAMRRARDAGIPVLGAYHVVRSPANASAEVDHHLSYVDSQTPWWRDFPCWFWQIDLELWSYDSVPASEGEAFADIIEERTGRPAVIYASRGQYGDQLSNSSHNLWNANYGPNADGHYRDIYAARGGDSGPGWARYSGRTPIMWQYGSRTTIGSQNICDASAFRGTLAELTTILKGNTMTPLEEAELLRSVQATELTLGSFIHGWLETILLKGADGVTKQFPIIPNQILAELKTRPATVTMTEADRAAIVAGVVAQIKPSIDALRSGVETDTRDAVADLGEGGATAVRADAS